MPENFNDQFEKFRQMYDASSIEKRAAIRWLLENFEFVDRITECELSESDIQNLLSGNISKTADYILKFILLFQQFKQEQSAADEMEE